MGSDRLYNFFVLVCVAIGILGALVFLSFLVKLTRLLHGAFCIPTHQPTAVGIRSGAALVSSVHLAQSEGCR
jgi:hypothetical protein